ncbi:MAG: hypothetical protein ACTJHW_10475 [Paenalcaligenes sp.]
MGEDCVCQDNIYEPDETGTVGRPFVFADQSEAYKDVCVREALEQAAKKPREYALQLDKNGWGNRFPDELAAIFNAADNMADRIRALIPKR